MHQLTAFHRRQAEFVVHIRLTLHIDHLAEEVAVRTPGVSLEPTRRRRDTRQIRVQRANGTVILREVATGTHRE